MIEQRKNQEPKFVRELRQISQAIQWGRLFLSANPFTVGGPTRDDPDVTIWTHLTSPPPSDQDDMVLIKQQKRLYTVTAGHFCLTGAGDIYTCTDDTPGALVWALVGASADGVTAGSDIEDNAIVRGDGGGKEVQESDVTISDSGVMALGASGQITLGNHGTLAQPAIKMYGQGGNSVGFYTRFAGGQDILHFVANGQDIAQMGSGSLVLLTNEFYPDGAGRNLGRNTTQRWEIYADWINQRDVNGGGALRRTFAGVTVAQTVIPNGTGDVTLVLSGTYTISDGAGNVSGGEITPTEPGSNFDLYDDGGTNTCQLQVAADGGVTVVRTNGARTYLINLDINWL